MHIQMKRNVGQITQEPNVEIPSLVQICARFQYQPTTFDAMLDVFGIHGSQRFVIAKIHEAHGDMAFGRRAWIYVSRDFALKHLVIERGKPNSNCAETRFQKFAARTLERDLKYDEDYFFALLLHPIIQKHIQEYPSDANLIQCERRHLIMSGNAFCKLWMESTIAKAKLSHHETLEIGHLNDAISLQWNFYNYVKVCVPARFKLDKEQYFMERFVETIHELRKKIYRNQQ